MNGIIKLFHGTSLASATHLRDHGLDEQAARRENGDGTFWATTGPDAADFFARANPASPPAARFEFELPELILVSLISAQPPSVREDKSYSSYEFLPQSFNIVNKYMESRNIVHI